MLVDVAITKPKQVDKLTCLGNMPQVLLPGFQWLQEIQRLQGIHEHVSNQIFLMMCQGRQKALSGTGSLR